MNFYKETLKNKDKLIYKLLKKEKRRQKEKLILNAATSITPKSILEIQGSIFDNIDAEGYIPNYIKEKSIRNYL